MLAPRVESGARGGVAIYRVVDALSGRSSRHRLRRTLAYALGALLLVASYAALLPAMIFVAAFAIFSITEKKASVEGVETSTILVLIGCIVVAVALWRLGLRLIRGHRHLVLFLRKFGFTTATEALSVAVGTSIGRRWRLVTLDDHDVAPLGVGRRSRWSVRILRLLLMVAMVAATVAAVRAVSGDAFDRIADQAHDDAVLQAQEEGKSALEAEIGAVFAGAFVGAISMVCTVIIWSIMIAFAGTGGLLFSFVSRSARRAEHTKAVMVTSDDAVEQVARRLRRRTKKVLSPRIVVARVTDPCWKAFVRRMATTSDAVLVDVSRPTENLVWEIRSLDEVRARWLPIGEVDQLHDLQADQSPAAVELRRLLGDREVLGYRPVQLETFSSGLRHSLDVVAASPVPVAPRLA